MIRNYNRWKEPILYSELPEEKTVLYHRYLRKNKKFFEELDLTPSVRIISDPVFSWDMNGCDPQPLTIYNKKRGEDDLFTIQSEVQYEAKQTLEGNYFIIQNKWLGHYGHNMHDSLGMYEYVRNTFGDQVKIIVTGYNKKVHKTTIEQLKCISSYYNDSIIYVPPNQITRISGSLMLMPTTFLWWQSPKLYGKYLRQGLLKEYGQTINRGDREKIIFCPRIPTLANHGRCNNPDQMQKIENLIKDIASKHSKPTAVKIFHHEQGGKTLTAEEQKKIFKTGTIIIGIHGTAMTNMAWTERAVDFSLAPLQVIESVGNTTLRNMDDPPIEPWQPRNDLGYWNQFSNNFNISWRHLFYSPLPGAKNAKIVDMPLNFLEQALKDSLEENREFYHS